MVAIGALFFTNGAAFASWAPRIPELADRVGLDVAGLGLTLMLLGVGGLTGTQPAGMSIDRFGSRRTAIGGGFVVAATLPLIGLASSPVALGAGLFLIGASDVSADLGMNAQAMVAQRGRSSLINRFHGLWSIGTVVGGLLGAGAAGAGVSLFAHFAAVSTVIATITWLAGRELGEDSITPETPSGETVRKAPIRPLVVLGSLGFLAAFVEAPGGEWSATFLDEALGASPATAGLGFVAVTVGMTISRLWGDAISLRLSNLQSFMASVLATAAGWSIATFPGTVPTALMGLAIAGLGAGMVFPQLYAAGGAGTVVSQGRGLGAMSVGARLGFLLATPSVGLLGSRIGLGTALAAIVGVAAATAAVVAWMDDRQRP